MKEKAIVLMSGGMDSTVCAGLAIERGFDVYALHVHYGQRTQEREAQAFNDVCMFYGIFQKLDVDISYLAKIGGSSLTDSSFSIEKANLDHDGIPTSYVPFRNANLLSIAVSWAEVIGAKHIFIGAVEEDGSGYPDCRKTFFESFERMIEYGTKPDTDITIQTPIINKKKSQIILEANRISAPLHLTWSCYSQNETACGICDSCALRLRGFSEAGCQDPIPYQERLA
ncbi:MAG: 7-cyano-7-deazaguanine synthase QueC [bacterium]